MPFDPWSRPTLAELPPLPSAGRKKTASPLAQHARFPCRIPAELITARGNSVSAMTHEIGAECVALIHKGFVPVGAAELRLSHDRESNDRHVHVVSSTPCARGLYVTEVVITSNDPPPDQSVTP